MSNPEIKQGENKFYIGDDENNALAEIAYRSVDNNEINIDHTGISDEFGSQGVDKKLLKAVVEHARENNLKIIVSCLFTEHMLEKEDSYQDVCLGQINLAMV